MEAEGREFLYCGGTSYLGMARNEDFATLLAEGMRRYGTNYASSRLSNVQLRVFEEAESHLAAYAGAEAALTVSSGYLAGQMVVKTWQGNGHFLYAPGTHPAVWLETPIPSEPDYTTWTTHLIARIYAEPATDWVLVCNSLDPLLARRHRFDWIRQLPSGRAFTLLIDDSHGFGLIGREGAGIYAELTVPDHVRLVVVSSFGKAFGIPGGVILSDRATVERLKRSPFFGASSPVIPAYLHAFLRAGELYRQARAQLSANVRRFAQRAMPTGLFQTFPDYPVFYTPVNDLYAHLRERNVLISSFPYPSPQDNCLTRIVLNSLHTAADVDRLADLTEQYATQ